VQVGPIEAEPVRGEVVEGAVLVARDPELADQLSDQILLLLAAWRQDDPLSTKMFSN
jgi:hypothetical protein